MQLIARHVYGIDQITSATLRAAQPKLDELRKPGGRLALLRDQAGLEHIQTDDKTWDCPPDLSGPDFFFYDLSWRSFCTGAIDPGPIAEHTGITVSDLTTLDLAMEALFDRYASTAIAVKTQHAYARTLCWSPRSRADANRALQSVLVRHEDADEEDACA